MPRKWNRKQWYQYHRAKAEEKAKEDVYEAYRDEIETLTKIRDATSKEYSHALEAEPTLSWLLGCLGSETRYRQENLAPLQSDLQHINRALHDVYERRRKGLQIAARDGGEEYERARAARKREAEKRAERVVKRKYERRLRYLERSPAIRSAARSLKEHLIKEQSDDGFSVTCFYCGITIPAGESHLEHKRPISRGGTNKRGNLALSCASCNLSKGKMTHEEYLRQFGAEAP